MLEQIARVLFWLCVIEIGKRSGLLPLPATPVTGLTLFYVELAVRGKIPGDLGVLADRIRRSSRSVWQASCRGPAFDLSPGGFDEFRIQRPQRVRLRAADEPLEPKARAALHRFRRRCRLPCRSRLKRHSRRE